MTGRARVRSILVGAAAVTVLALPGPAVAADEVSVDHVEVAEDGTVSVLLGLDGIPGGAEADLDGIEVSVGGEPVDVEAEAVTTGQIQRTTVLALDASISMRGDSFVQAREAAKAFVEAAPPDVSIGLLTFSGTVQDTIVPTTDHAALADAVDEIELTRGTHVYEAVAEAAGLAGAEGARSVLVLSDGEDQGGGTTLDEAVSAVQDAGVVVDVVALDQTSESRALLSQVAQASGGRVIEAADPAALTAVFTDQADALAGQVLLEFPQPAEVEGEASVEVRVPSGSSTFTDSAFVTLAAPADPGPKVVEQAEPPVGTTALVVGAGALTLGLAVLLAMALGGARGPSEAEQKLAAYFGTQGETGQGKGKGRSADQPSLRETAVAVTQTIVKGDFEARLTMRLAGAGSALTAAEWLLLHAGITTAATFAGFVLRGTPAALLGLVLGGVGPWLWLRRRHSKRLAAFNSQLAETLTLLAGGLSAGLSMPQAIDTVVRQGNEPMSSELRRALMEARLGVEIEDTLDSLAERMRSEDFSWVVMAIRIQREVGGNLAELLTTVSETLRERDYLRRQVKVLSAEGRMSAYVLGGLPIVMFIYMLLVRPEAVEPLYTTGIGFVMSAVAVTMLVMGFFVMSRIVKIEV